VKDCPSLQRHHSRNESDSSDLGNPIILPPRILPLVPKK
jgi:hypothetical protein